MIVTWPWYCPCRQMCRRCRELPAKRDEAEGWTGMVRVEENHGQFINISLYQRLYGAPCPLYWAV
jgi:hypothetical protein